MFAVIEVISGSQRGWRVPFRSGQVVRVGRTDWADLSIPDDESLQAVHFIVRAEGDGCHVRRAAADADMMVNDEVVDQCLLGPGDLIKAGGTTFMVHISSISSQGSESVEKLQPSSDEIADIYDTQGNMLKVCAFAELNDDAAKLATERQSPRELIDLLMEQEEYAAAMQMQCHWMPKPRAVAWTARWVREIMGEALPQPQMAALEAAEQWAADPTEENRRGAEPFQAAPGKERAGALLAVAAFASGGSLVAPEYTPVVPDERITARLAAGAITIAAYHGDPAAAPERFRKFLADARRE